MRLFFLVGLLALASSGVGKASEGRRLACHFSYRNSEGTTHVIPGRHPVAFRMDDLRAKVKAAIAAKKDNAQSVIYETADDFVKIRLEAVMGTACSVLPAPGCQSYSDGGPANRYTVTVIDKRSGQTVSVSDRAYDTDEVRGRYPTVSFTPTEILKDEEGKTITRIAVGCGDVAY